MKNVESLRRGVAKARRFWNDRRFDQALAEVERLLRDWPNNPHLLVMRADLIQLQDENCTLSLEDVKSDLMLAVKLDEDSPAALIELAHFVYVHEDDATVAVKQFQKAARMCRRLLSDALTGQAKALTELGRDADAQACLMEALSQSHKSDSPEILEQIRELIDEQLTQFRRAE